MADRRARLPENAEGPFFVDSICIDCDTCRQLAPRTFAETGEFSYVHTQPRDTGEKRAALRALVACPTGSIGTADKLDIAEAVADFPLELAPHVFKYAARFGAARIIHRLELSAQPDTVSGRTFPMSGWRARSSG